MLNLNRIFSRGDKKPIYVLDTSAIGCKKTMNLIEEDCKVILTSVVLKEMDYRKKIKSSQIFVSRISKILSECARDENSRKYEIVELQNEWKVDKQDVTNISRSDDAILEFCKTNKNYILLTADNAMACKARMKGIQYRVFDVDKEVQAENKKNSENKICHLYGTKIQNNRLVLENPRTFMKSYLVLDRNSKMKFSLDKSFKILNKGDKVCVATVNNENEVIFSFYEIIDIAEQKNALYKKNIKIKDSAEIEKLDFSETVKKFMQDFANRF